MFWFCFSTCLFWIGRFWVLWIYDLYGLWREAVFRFVIRQDFVGFGGLGGFSFPRIGFGFWGLAVCFWFFLLTS